MDKKKWLEWWKQAIIDSGYYFMLDTDSIEKRITEKEMIDLSPEESASIYIAIGKERYNADKNGG